VARTLRARHEQAEEECEEREGAGDRVQHEQSGDRLCDDVRVVALDAAVESYVSKKECTRVTGALTVRWPGSGRGYIRNAWPSKIQRCDSISTSTASGRRSTNLPLTADVQYPQRPRRTLRSGMPYRYMLLMIGVDRVEKRRRMKAKRVKMGVSQPKIILDEGGAGRDEKRKRVGLARGPCC
jgi:hypothetical protein